MPQRSRPLFTMLFQETIDQNLPLISTHPEATRIHAEMLEIELEISKLKERYKRLSSQLNRSSSDRPNLPRLNLDQNSTFPRIMSQNSLKSNLPAPPACKENSKSNLSCYGEEDTVFRSHDNRSRLSVIPSPLNSPTLSLSLVDEQTISSSIRSPSYESISQPNSPEPSYNDQKCSENRRYRQSSPPSRKHRSRDKTPDNERRTRKSNVVDTAVNLLLIQNLMQRPKEQIFDGNPLKFHLWFNELNRQIEKLNAGPMDAIMIFRSNSVGEPKELIERLMSNGDDSSKRILKRIIKELEERYGNSLDISRNIREKIQNLPTIYKSDDSRTYFKKLREISETCVDATNARRKAQSLRILDCPDEIDKIRLKLPNDLNDRWRRKRYRILQKYSEEPRFSEFSEFLEKETQIIWTDRYFQSCLPIAPSIKGVKNEFKRLVRGFKRHSSPKTNKYCILHNSEHHDTKWCVKYKKMEDTEKWFLRRKHDLCDRCLKNHSSKFCSNLT